jgi:predicted O-methyltransferase YrrM
MAKVKDLLWENVDRYFADLLPAPDRALGEALAANARAGLPAIDVAPNQGRLLHLLARMMGARAILEVGTLGGYSTIWLARALPAGGRLVSLEANPQHAEVARSNLARAGVAGRVEVRVGPALDTLPGLTGPFDFAFLDADKPNTAGYFREALRLTRPGGVIVTDNVVRGGGVIDAVSTDPNVVGMRQFHAMLAAEPRVFATTIQTVGVKGYDGFTIALVS